MEQRAEMKASVNKEIETIFYETFEKEFSCHVDKSVKEQDDRNYSFMAAMRPS